LELHTLPGAPLEEREQRERMAQTSMAKIKILEHECINMCDEGTHIWIDLTTNLDLQALEKKKRTMQEKMHKDNERVNTLPPIEIMTTLPNNRKLYSEVEQMKEEQRKFTYKLKP
jgi:hypothetical protein